MSEDPRSARNRANAAKSTGPRTEAGKARAAQNARRHGATARPDRERTRLWLGIILDDPDPDLARLDLDRERDRLALALAEAEASVAATERALAEYEAGRAPLSDDARRLIRDIEALAPAAEGRVRDVKNWRDLQSAARMLTKHYARQLEKELHGGGIRHHLLYRYASEARGRRRRAFAAWAAFLEKEQALTRAREQGSPDHSPLPQMK